MLIYMMPWQKDSISKHNNGIKLYMMAMTTLLSLIAPHLLPYLPLVKSTTYSYSEVATQ